ncbi:MAG: hypothetical protein Kow00100_01950 [Geothermobacteraceae bacterium]
MDEWKAVPMADALTKSIGDFVAEDYRTAAVFEKYGIDFCCGGQVSLAVTCQEKGLNPTAILGEIEAAKQVAMDRSQNYGSWELPFLADYIINTHHAYLNENTGRLPPTPARSPRSTAPITQKWSRLPPFSTKSPPT